MELQSVPPAITHVTIAPLSTPAIPAQPTLTVHTSSPIYVPATQAIMITAIPPALSAVPIASLASLTLNAFPATPRIIAPYPLTVVPAPMDITKTASTPPALLAIIPAPSVTAVLVQTATTAPISAHLPCHTAAPA